MSFFADLIGNLAMSGEKVVDDKIALRDKMAAEERASALALQRAKDLKQAELDMADKAALAKRARVSQDMQAIDAATPELTRARQVGEANRVAPSVDGNVLDIIKSRLSSDELNKFYGVNDRADATLMDKLGVARSKGMFDAEAQLEKSYKDTVAAIRLQLDERKVDNAEKKGDQQYEVGMKRADNQLAGVLAAVAGREKVAETKANGKDSSLGRDRLTLQEVREDRVRLNQAKTNLLSEFKEGLITQAEYNTEKAALNKRLADLDKAPTASDKPAAEGGKPATQPGGPSKFKFLGTVKN